MFRDVYTQRHIGGKKRPDNNQEYINNQQNILENNNRYLQPNVRYNNPRTSTPSKSISYGNDNVRKDIYMRNDKDRYDPYDNYLYTKGLMQDGETIRRFRTSFVNIDSRKRITLPSADLDESVALGEDPLDFSANSKNVFIKHPDHNYEIGDLIALDNVFGDLFILRTFDDRGVPSFSIPRGCNIMKITLPQKHNLNNYNDDIIEIDISGVKGDRGSIETSSYLGNLPVNIINTRHKIIINPNANDLDPNCVPPQGFLDPSDNDIFVILPLTMHNDNPPYVLGEYSYRVKFLAIAGIPINLLNSGYPIDPARRQGYLVITAIRDNGYFIETPVAALTDDTGGGDCVNVSKILSINTGYPNANNYTINLGNTFHDVISVRLVSFEFPNSDTAVRAFPPERANNKIYWNDIDDGDFLYSIEIPAGNYSSSDLILKMESLFLNTPRVNSGANIGSNYEPNHFIKVGINSTTNEVTFESFKEFCLIQPIIEVTPEITTGEPNREEEANSQYTITINHPGHSMVTPGQTILISGALSHVGIPSTIINGEQTVTEIIDADTYKITFPKCSFNLSDTRVETRGGAAVTILIPDLFRLRFDEDDTMGALLGFRNPGDPNSIFPFQQKISNKDRYEFDLDENALGEQVIIDNNSIQLSGDDYVLMVVEPLVALRSVGDIRDAFAKIQLCDTPGKVLFNTHVSTPIKYVDPEHQIDDLIITFYTQDGFLYDFNGIDHSFTLELVTVNDIPVGTGINANTGRNYNLRQNSNNFIG